LGSVKVFQPNHHPLKKNDSQGERAKSDVLLFWLLKLEDFLEEQNIFDDTETLNMHKSYGKSGDTTLPWT